jgi:hypothetical protein
MELEQKKTMARLLREAASRTIEENLFWDQFKPLVGDFSDPIAGAAYESAVHYWGNFHERNLLLIKTKPDRWQLENGRNELNLIADALDENWSAPDLKRKLKGI